MGIHKFPTGKLKTKMSNLNLNQQKKSKRVAKNTYQGNSKGKRNSVWI